MQGAVAALTIVAISGLEETLDADGIQELEVYIIESDESRFLPNPEFPWSLD